MMQQKADVAATAASYAAGVSGVTIASWLAENWLAVLSALMLLATYATQIYFSAKREQRERDRAARDVRREKREKERHDAAMHKLDNVHDSVKAAAEADGGE